MRLTDRSSNRIPRTLCRAPLPITSRSIARARQTDTADEGEFLPLHNSQRTHRYCRSGVAPSPEVRLTHGFRSLKNAPRLAGDKPQSPIGRNSNLRWSGLPSTPYFLLRESPSDTLRATRNNQIEVARDPFRPPIPYAPSSLLPSSRPPPTAGTSWNTHHVRDAPDRSDLGGFRMPCAAAYETSSEDGCSTPQVLAVYGHFSCLRPPTPHMSHVPCTQSPFAPDFPPVGGEHPDPVIGHDTPGWLLLPLPPHKLSLPF